MNFAATDAAGNVEVSKSVTIKIDRTAPSTTSAATPAADSGGWNTTDVTITLNAVDNPGGSGVQGIQYGAPTGSNMVPGDSATVTITAEGINIVNYAAGDNAMNQEAVKTLTVKIDKTGPAITGMPPQTCTLSPAKHQLVQVASVVASDSLSGVLSLNVSASSSEPDSGLGGGDVAGDIVINGGQVFLRAERSPSSKGRVYTIVATAKDVAGNTSSATGTCTVPK